MSEITVMIIGFAITIAVICVAEVIIEANRVKASK